MGCDKGKKSDSWQSSAAKYVSTSKKRERETVTWPSETYVKRKAMNMHAGIFNLLATKEFNDFSQR